MRRVNAGAARGNTERGWEMKKVCGFWTTGGTSRAGKGARGRRTRREGRGRREEVGVVR